MRTSSLPIRVAALYQFTHFSDCAVLRETLLQVCRARNIRGTLLLAAEGINGTIAGSDSDIEEVLSVIRTLPGCTGLEVKNSRAHSLPFARMKVRIKREIVTMGQPMVNAQSDTGEYVSPEDWNDLISQPATILLDVRNDYEVAMGTFENAVNPGIKTFREFPAWVDSRQSRFATGENAPEVAMFCTGGIRCEKASAYLKLKGIKNVYHLKGGILKYLESVPGENSRWNGECFVFDQRVALKHGLDLHGESVRDESRTA